MGLIAGAMEGAGAGLANAGRQLGDYAEKSTLQSEAAEIAKARDIALSELRKGELTFGDDLKRRPLMDAAAEADKARTGTVDADVMGTQRPRNASEIRDAEQSAYKKRGLIGEAMQLEGHDIQREQNATTDRYHSALLEINKAAEGRLEAGAKLDNALKSISLSNAKRVEDLRSEFTDATPERKKAINEEIQTLTGKDNDKFMPVPLKDEMGNVTGYRIFDTKAGKWMDDPVGDNLKTGAKWDSASRNVYLDGKVIGTAKDEAEARGIIAKARKGVPAAPAPAPARPAPAPAAPAMESAPGSPAALHQKRARQTREADTQATTDAQTRFSSDVQSMSPQDLYDAYDNVVSRLTSAQQAAYQRRIREIK